MGTSASNIGLAGTPPSEWKNSRILTIGPGFFATMEIPIVAGRDLGAHDGPQTTPVALVNQTFARKFFGEQNPIGSFLVLRSPCGGTAVCGGARWKDVEFEVIGVSADARYGSLKGDLPAVLYLPYMQEIWYPIDTLTYELRLAGNPSNILKQVRSIVAHADPRVPIAEAKTQKALIDNTILYQVVFARLCAVFAVLALTIACVGLYGTTAYTVARRTNEIGIRMALGAPRHRVLRIILSEALASLAIGVAISIPVTRVATRTLESFLFEVAPGDPFAVVAAIGILITAVLIAGYLPARHAARIDPMVALRHD